MIVIVIVIVKHGTIVKSLKKIPFSITNIGNEIEFRIGKIVEGFKVNPEKSISHGMIFTGMSNDGKTKVLSFKYEALPYFVIITDEEIIDNILHKERGYWMPQLVELFFNIASIHGQTRFIVEKTIELTAKKNFDAGKQFQSKNVLKTLGVDLDSINFNWNQ